MTALVVPGALTSGVRPDARSLAAACRSVPGLWVGVTAPSGSEKSSAGNEVMPAHRAPARPST
jgi:hypothetical protein